MLKSRARRAQVGEWFAGRGRAGLAEIGAQCEERHQAVHAAQSDGELHAVPCCLAAEIEQRRPIRRRRAVEPRHQIGPRHRHLACRVHRQRPGFSLIDIGFERRPDEGGSHVAGENIVQRQQAVAGRDVAAERMIEDDHVVGSRQFGDRREFKPMQGARRPLDLDAGMLLREHRLRRQQRIDRAAMIPRHSTQAYRRHPALSPLT